MRDIDCLADDSLKEWINPEYLVAETITQVCHYLVRPSLHFFAYPPRACPPSVLIFSSLGYI